MKHAAIEGAFVWRENERVGRLLRNRDGGVFEYDPGFLERAEDNDGIAYRIPLTPSGVETRGTNVHPFFAGLLPEGSRLRALEQRVKTSKDDLLSLLAVAGGDAIGDISVTYEEPTAGEVQPSFVPSRAADVSFRELLKDALKGMAFDPALPGVQEKISAGRVSFPLQASKGRGESFILKLSSEATPCVVENEDFFLRMGRDAGLESASAKLIRDRDGEVGLLVHRFDRVRSGRLLRKIHQEDACQFLDRYPADKYALSCADIARGVAELASAPIVEIAKLLRMFAFSYLIANGDLHAKNISLRTVANRIELTPAYDLLSTLPYGDRTMALKLDGRDDNFKRSTLVLFGERHGVRARAVDAMLDRLCDSAPSWIARLHEIGLPPRKTADLARVMKKRREDLA